ncbi:MAG: hypothetical protein ABIJ48_04980 [Actinomycetota bacterium]
MNRSYDPRPPTRLAFHASRIVIDAGVLLVLGAMSLPFVTAEGFQQRALAGDGLPALLLLLPVFVITLLPDHSTPLPNPLGWASLLLGATALPYSVVKYLDASTLAGTLQGSVGMGPRVLVMGAFAVLGGVVIGLIRTMLRLPTADSTPAEAAAPAGAIALAEGRAVKPPPSTPPRTSPRWRRFGAPREAAQSSRRSPAPGPEPSPLPVTDRLPARVAPRPQPADPDTEPTVPAQRPVQPWWPEDLDDLFT